MDLESPVKPEAGEGAGVEVPLVNGQGEGGEGPGEGKAPEGEGVGVRVVQDSASPPKTVPTPPPQLNGALDNSVGADSVDSNISQDITNHNVDTLVTNKYLIQNYGARSGTGHVLARQPATSVFNYDSSSTGQSTAAQRPASPERSGQQQQQQHPSSQVT